MYKDLSLKEKSELFKLMVSNGITDINEIERIYNSYQNGGNKISVDNLPESEQYAVTTPDGQRKVFNTKEEAQQYITANTPKGYSLYDTTNYGTNIDKGQTAILNRNTEREIEKATEQEKLTATRLANRQQNQEIGKEILLNMPGISDINDVYQIGKDAYNGNYLNAGIGLGLLALPNVIEKPIKYVGKGIKKLYTNITDRLNTNTNLIDLNTNLFNDKKLEEPTLFIEDDGKVKEVFPTPVYENNLPNLNFDNNELNKIDNYFKNIYLKKYLKNRNVNIDDINPTKPINNSTISTDLGKIVHTNPDEIEYLKETGGGFSENGIAYLDDSYKTMLPPTHEIRHNHRDSNLESQDFFKNGEEFATRLDGGTYKYPISEKYYTKKEVDLVQNGYMFPKGFESKMSEHQVLAEKANLNSDIQLYLVNKYNLQDDTQLVSKIEELSDEDLFSLLSEVNSPYAKKATSALRILRPNKDTYDAVLNNMKEALKYVPATIGVTTGLSLLNNNDQNVKRFGGKINKFDEGGPTKNIDKNNTFWEKADQFVSDAEYALTIPGLALSGITLALPNPATFIADKVVDGASMLLDGYQVGRAIYNKDWDSLATNSLEFVLAAAGAKDIKNSVQGMLQSKRAYQNAITYNDKINAEHLYNLYKKKTTRGIFKEATSHAIPFIVGTINKTPEILDTKEKSDKTSITPKPIVYPYLPIEVTDTLQKTNKYDDGGNKQTTTLETPSFFEGDTWKPWYWGTPEYNTPTLKDAIFNAYDDGLLDQDIMWNNKAYKAKLTPQEATEWRNSRNISFGNKKTKPNSVSNPRERMLNTYTPILHNNNMYYYDTYSRNFYKDNKGTDIIEDPNNDLLYAYYNQYVSPLGKSNNYEDMVKFYIQQMRNTQAQRRKFIIDQDLSKDFMKDAVTITTGKSGTSRLGYSKELIRNIYENLPEYNPNDVLPMDIYTALAIPYVESDFGHRVNSHSDWMGTRGNLIPIFNNDGYELPDDTFYGDLSYGIHTYFNKHAKYNRKTDRRELEGLSRVEFLNKYLTHRGDDLFDIELLYNKDMLNHVGESLKKSMGYNKFKKNVLKDKENPNFYKVAFDKARIGKYNPGKEEVYNNEVLKTAAALRKDPELNKTLREMGIIK